MTLQASNRFNLILIAIVAIFPIAPLATVLLFSSLLFVRKNIDDYAIFIFIFILALYLGLINATKLPESDYAVNIDLFLSASKFTFFQYITQQGKEPVFYALNYVIFYLTNGNYIFYTITLTFISYTLIFSAIFRYFRALGQSESIIVFSILIFAFLPQAFSFSAHLIRQFIAGSIMIYVIVNKAFYKKNSWILAFAGIFIHTSSIIFLTGLLPYINKRIKMPILLAITIGALFSLNILQKTGSFFTSIFSNEIVSYGFRRLAGSIQDLSSTHLSFLPLLVLGVLGMIALNELYLRKISDVRLIRFLNSFLFIGLFVIGVYDNSLLSSRMFVYIYLFLPFIFPLLSYTKPSIVRINLAGCMILFFFFYLANLSTWTYAPLYYIFSNPILYLK